MATKTSGSRSNRPASIRERLSWRMTPKTYSAIRRLWIDHSKAEDKRNLDGLIATLTEDCVYEIVPTGLRHAEAASAAQAGQRWEGHAGAREFYTSFLGAFPDVKFDLTDIVIGPQGVFEVATMTGTHQGVWNGIAPTGRAIRTTVLIFFPWDRRAAKFSGEKIYVDVGRLVAGE